MSNRILGIDPGLQCCGWGVIEQNGNALAYIASGTIKTKASEPLSQRLATIHNSLSEVLARFNIGTAAIEETFVNKNPASALKLGQARGVALAVPALRGVEVSEYAANKIKKSLVGAGHADKTQIQMMVRTLLPACGQVGADEADALAVAITHAHYSQTGLNQGV